MLEQDGLRVHEAFGTLESRLSATELGLGWSLTPAEEEGAPSEWTEPAAWLTATDREGGLLSLRRFGAPMLWLGAEMSEDGTRFHGGSVGVLNDEGSWTAALRTNWVGSGELGLWDRAGSWTFLGPGQ